MLLLGLLGYIAVAFIVAVVALIVDHSLAYDSVHVAIGMCWPLSLCWLAVAGLFLGVAHSSKWVAHAITERFAR